MPYCKAGSSLRLVESTAVHLEEMKGTVMRRERIEVIKDGFRIVLAILQKLKMLW